MTWHDIALQTPTDGSTVWVRRGWFSSPFSATWHDATADFTLVDGRTCPWWIVSRWK